MFFSDAPSPYDLHFRFLGFPVRVQPWFWLIMAIFGWNWSGGNPRFLVIWVACAFVSILVHELGHAIAFRIFGSWSSITLHGFGGYAQTNNPPREAWQRLIVSAAGPVAGFLLVGIIVATGIVTRWPLGNIYLEEVYDDLWFMGVFWGILNLMPIWPLDGGKIAREVFVMLRMRRPDVLTHQISIGIAGLLAFLALAKALQIQIPGLEPLLVYVPRSLYMAIWFGLFAYQNWQMLQIHLQHRSFYDRDDDSPPWRR